MVQAVGTREIAKQAVRERISSAALRRFQSEGFQETTVEDIARDVGMSTRTFFRYVRSKDEVLLEAANAYGERFLRSLEANLPSKDLWTALTLGHEAGTEDCADPTANVRHTEMQALIRATPFLLGRQLEVMERLQIDVAELCRSLGPHAAVLSRATVQAVVGSAFACFQAAQFRSTPECGMGKELGLRDLMRDLRPRVLQPEE